jgi:hypothetical protein
MVNNTQLDSFNYKSIAGFNPSGHSKMCLFKDTLYVGTSAGIAMLDVSNPAQLRFIGRLSTSGSYGVLVTNDYLVTNDGNNLTFFKRGPASNTGILKTEPVIPYMIYPNPTERFLTLKLSNSSGATVLFYNNLGILAKCFIADKLFEQSIQIDDLPKGVYWIKTEVSGGSYTETIVIN